MTTVWGDLPFLTGCADNGASDLARGRTGVQCTQVWRVKTP